MSYAQHIHHGQGYAASPPDGGYPSAVPPLPGFFRDGPGPPPPPPVGGFFRDGLAPPPPAPPYSSGYQGYFDDGYPPPPREHIRHNYNQPWGGGYRDDNICSSLINTCLATLCCCCLLDRCFWCCY